MLRNPKSLVNCLNAQLSTGPKTSRGKRTSSRNSIKHGLNVEIDFESSGEYASLKSLLIEEGYSLYKTAYIASSLLNYRRVMDAYYKAYTQSKKVNEAIWDMGPEDVHIDLRRLPAESLVTVAKIQSTTRLFARLQRDEHRRGRPVFRRTVDCHKLIRYQRNAISRLSKAIHSE